VEVAPNFTPQCRYVLETLGGVYGNDETAREQAMTPDARLAYHQARSGPLMEQLRQWGESQLDQHKVEPNSGLGKAIRYLLKHWRKLTLFLRQPGAPLDSNIVERALKKAILNRKNALFYKTRNGARVGDLFMSLIHTCELCGGNPFDYLTELQKHAAEIEPVDAVELSCDAGTSRAGQGGITPTARRKGHRMIRKKGSSTPAACQACQGTDLVRRITTYPVHLTGELKGKRIHVGRVALYQCRSCGHLTPTPAGQAKVDRNAIWESGCCWANCTEIPAIIYIFRGATHAYRTLTYHRRKLHSSRCSCAPHCPSCPSWRPNP